MVLPSLFLLYNLPPSNGQLTNAGTLCKMKHIIHAGMAELADAPDLGSGGVIHAGSIPVTRTK